MRITPAADVSVSLASILIGESGADFADVSLACCGDDPEERLEGGAFICVADEPEIAARAIATARANGAVAAVVAAGLKDRLNFAADGSFQIVCVDDVRAVVARAHQAFCDFPARKMKIVAVAGSTGKTSALYVVGAMLAEAGFTVGLIGSLGVYDGVKIVPQRESTPEPRLLAKFFTEMVENGCECAVVEVSSIALAEKRFAGVEFDAVCLTNLRRKHLDYHKTLDAYRRAQIQVFDYLKPDGVVVYNADDPAAEAVVHIVNPPAAASVGIESEDAAIVGKPVESMRGEQTFYIVAGVDCAPVQTKIDGKSFIYNCLTAAMLGLVWNVELQTIIRGFDRLKRIPGRFERIDCGQPFGVFLDVVDTRESLAETLATLRSLYSGSLYCVLSAPDDSDRGKRPGIGRVAETAADYVVITSGQNAPKDDKEAIDDLVRGCKTPLKIQVLSNRADAIVWALSQVGPNDCALIVTSDPPMPEDVVADYVSDRQFVKRWLYENQPGMEQFWS